MSQVMKEEQPVNGQSIDPDILSRVAGEITGCIELGVQVALVIGGGNIYRGAELEKAGLNRVIGDQMGMLATVMNGLAMADALHHFGVHSTLMCAVEIEGVAKRFNWNDGRRALNDGRVVICSGGTGNPFFTTDTAACLRGAELGVQAVFKGTRVDGVYSADPEKDSSAVSHRLCPRKGSQAPHKSLQYDKVRCASPHPCGRRRGNSRNGLGLRQRFFNIKLCPYGRNIREENHD